MESQSTSRSSGAKARRATLRPLSRYQYISSLDIDETRHKMSKVFCAHKLDFIDREARFETVHNRLPGTYLSLNYLEYGGNVFVSPGELEKFYMIQIPLSGFCGVTNGAKRFLSHANVASLLNADRNTEMQWRGSKQLLLQIDKKALHALAEKSLDRELNHDIIFDPELDLARPEMAEWKNLVHRLYQMAESQRGENGLGVEQTLLEQAVIEHLIGAQPSTVSHFAATAEKAAHPAHLTRAVDFIRENAGHPVDLSDIAKAANMAIRTLQHGFQKEFGLSPLALLRKERLHRARQDLLTGGPKSSVTNIAMRWGFYHLGRFAGAYCRAFGERPSQTARSSTYHAG